MENIKQERFNIKHLEIWKGNEHIYMFVLQNIKRHTFIKY